MVNALKNSAEIVATVRNLVAPAALVVISIVADLNGHFSIALLSASLSILLFVYQLDWPRKALGIEIERWQLWFSVECACCFFFISSFGIPSKGYIFDALLLKPSQLSLWTIVFDLLRLSALLFIFFRHVYLVPNRLRKYLGNGEDGEKIAALRGERERGVIALCCILGLGFGVYLDAILLLSTMFLVINSLKHGLGSLKPRSSLEKAFREYQVQTRGFWTHFFQVPTRFSRALFILSFMYFLNLPSWNFFSYQDLIMVILLSVAMLLMGGIVYYGRLFKKAELAITTILVVAVGFAIFSGEPTVFPFIRLFIRDPGFEFQYLLLSTQFWLICMCVFLLNVKGKEDLKASGATLRRKIKDEARILWYVVLTLSYVIMLVLVFGSISVPQIRLLLIFGLALLFTIPLFKDLKA